MILVALFVGVVLIVAAIRNSHKDLFGALATDIPNFVIWGAAILAVGSIGFIPGLKPISRGLLALIITVIVLQNYKGIIKGFENAWQHPPEADTGTVVDNSKAGKGIVGSPNIGDLFKLYQSAGGLDGGFEAGASG